MVEIKFGPWEVGTRPYGLKQSEADIFTAYIVATRHLNSRREAAGKPKPPKPPTPGSIIPEIAFQVHLLGGEPPPTGVNTDLKLDWELLSSMKADVIEKDGNNYTIYELKQRLDVCVLGQLLTYKFLFEDVLLYPRTTTLVAIGDFISPGLVQPLISNGIRVAARNNNWGIPSNFSALAIRQSALMINGTFQSGI